MSNQAAPVEKASTGKLIVPSLTLSYFSTGIMDLLLGLFLLEITLAFLGSSSPTSVATMSQIATVSNMAAVVTGFLIAFLSVKYRRKSLLLVGAFCIPVSVLGCFLASNFLVMQTFYAFDGIGSIIVGAMAFAIVGEVLPLNRRAKALGWIMSTAFFVGIVGFLVVRIFFANSGDWRSFLLWFALPVSVFSVFSVYFGVPSLPSSQEGKIEKTAYFDGLKQVFLNKSAVSCLFGNMLRQAGFMMLALFSATFMRVRFDLPLTTVAVVALISTGFLAVGSVVGGYIVNKIGRRRLLVLSLGIVGILLIPQTFVFNFYGFLPLSLIGAFLFGMVFTSSLSLIVEQVPKYRGTLMSINGIFNYFGAAVGTALGGLALALFGYSGLILAFAGIDFAAAAIYFFLTKDPCKT